MGEFIKDKDIIVPAQKGISYDLKPNKIYRLKTIKSMFSRNSILIEDGELNIPETLYYNDHDKTLIDRILKFHKNNKKCTTGVLFHGIQGCGKTLMAKAIAHRCNLPIIVVDPFFYTADLMDFFTKFSTETVILFDELDKHCGGGKNGNWDTKDMLEFLDGIQETNKKLVIFTCNDDSTVNKFMKNRCGRIRYYKNFTPLDLEIINKIINDKLTNKDKVKDISDFIYNRVKLPSYDNIISICDEINLYPDIDLSELIEDLNITLK